MARGISLRNDYNGDDLRSGASQMQYRRHEPSSARNLRRRCSRSTCHRHRRPGRLALLKNPGDTRQYHPAAPPPEITGTQPGRKHLAVHAR